MTQSLHYAAVTFGTILLIMVTVTIHVIALFGFQGGISQVAEWESHKLRHRAARETVFVGLIVVGLCGVHILEVLLWSFGYLISGALQSFGDAFYFSLTTYTTVGPVDVVVGPAFRSFAAIESLLGPIMLAWSTAFLVDILHKFPPPPTRHPGGQRHPAPAHHDGKGAP